MTKHNRSGFTIVELVITIAVIALLASITTIAYRTTQKNARDEKRKTDTIILMNALDEYYSDNGEYPAGTTCTSPGSSDICWRNEIWTILKNAGYLRSVPTPDTKATNSTYNVGAGGNANYGYQRRTTPAGYAVYVPRENGDCKTGKNVNSTTPMCDF